jgi:hypothetical protein
MGQTYIKNFIYTNARKNFMLILSYQKRTFALEKINTISCGGKSVNLQSLFATTISDISVRFKATR